MKIKIFFSLGVLVLISSIFSCSKDKENMKNMGDDASFRGSFVSAAHGTSGTASIDPEKTILSLSNFKTTSGPDLNIYLASSTALVENDYIDLGDLKGLDGNYTYDLPPGIDYAKYKYVVVWCVSFHVNFGYATLAPL